MFRFGPALALLIALVVGTLAAPATAAERADPVADTLARHASDCADAGNGDAAAAYRVARRYLFGLGVRRNTAVGAAWLRVAAEKGHATAGRLVGHLPRALGRFKPDCSRGGGGGGGGPRRFAKPPAEIVRIVEALAPSYGVDPQLVLAVIQVESGFRTDAVSPKNAAGLMQLIPDTAKRFSVSDVFDPTDNVRGGMAYLRWLLSYFRGDVTLAVAAYNAGERAVDRHGGIPPYAETQNYVRLIRRLYDEERHPFDPGVASPSPLVASLPERGKS